MKTHEIEKYASALLKWHASFAVEHAARRANRFAQLGDYESASAWHKIKRRTAELNWASGLENAIRAKVHSDEKQTRQSH